MKTCVIYARVSSREQREEGYSIEAQQKLLRDYALRNSLEISREFVEVESAKTKGRPLFEEMLRFFRKSGCNTLLVEKTDRLYRNRRDALAIEDADIEVHFVKENSVLSENARSQTKFMHDIHVAVATHYINNLCEEVKKGMAEKVAQGGWPHRPPFGYVTSNVTRSLEAHPETAQIVQRMFSLYASGSHSVSTVRATLRAEYGTKLSRHAIHEILRNPFYIGRMRWKGELHNGSHPRLVPSETWDRVQAELNGYNRPKYTSRHVAFRGLLTCAHDGCVMTAEVKKERYTYYRCTGYKGKCATPRFTEAEIAAKLGTVLEGIHIPTEIVAQISANLDERQSEIARQRDAERNRLESRLKEIEAKMDRVFDAKLDGSIPDDVVHRKLAQLRNDADQVTLTIAGLTDATPDKLLTVKRCLELANRASTLYKSQNPTEQAKLLKSVVLNCAVDELNLYPSYSKPFDLIFNRASCNEWRRERDSNPRYPFE